MPHAHGAQAGKHLERVDILAAVAAVATPGIPVDRADQPDLLVIAQCRLTEPAAPGDILDGESRHDCSKPNLKRLKSRTASDERLRPGDLTPSSPGRRPGAVGEFARLHEHRASR
jgi:hypothetical protein